MHMHARDSRAHLLSHLVCASQPPRALTAVRARTRTRTHTQVVEHVQRAARAALRLGPSAARRACGLFRLGDGEAVGPGRLRGVLADLGLAVTDGQLLALMQSIDPDRCRPEREGEEEREGERERDGGRERDGESEREGESENEKM